MSWVAVGVAAASAIVGGINAADQQQEKRNDVHNAAITNKYSPWTKLSAQTPSLSGTPSVLGGAAQGGVAGAMQASKFGDLFKDKPTTTPTPSPGTPTAGGGVESNDPSKWTQYA